MTWFISKPNSAFNSDTPQREVRCHERHVNSRGAGSPPVPLNTDRAWCVGERFAGLL
jgi:hypothetical protein